MTTQVTIETPGQTQIQQIDLSVKFSSESTSDIFWSATQKTAFAIATVLSSILASVKYVASEAMNVGIWATKRTFNYLNAKNEKPEPVEPSKPLMTSRVQTPPLAVAAPVVVVAEPVVVETAFIRENKEEVPVVAYSTVATSTVPESDVTVESDAALRANKCAKVQELCKKAWARTADAAYNKATHYANAAYKKAVPHMSTAYNTSASFAARIWAKLPTIQLSF